MGVASTSSRIPRAGELRIGCAVSNHTGNGEREWNPRFAGRLPRRGRSGVHGLEARGMRLAGLIGLRDPKRTTLTDSFGWRVSEETVA